jgi:dipeptidyl aminopeptidase/acylaminoacyl peptidase
MPNLSSRLGVVAFAVGLICLTSLSDASSERSWRATDSIAVRYFVDDQQYPAGLDGQLTGKGVVNFSPDKKHFFFVTRYGDLACDCNVYEIRVYSMADVGQALGSGTSVPEPRARAVLRSARSEYGYEGIREARWESNEAVVFLGVDGHGPRQAYRLVTKTGSLARLTNEASDQYLWMFSAQGDSIVYSASALTPRSDLDQYPVVTVKNDELRQLSGALQGDYKLFVSKSGAEARAVLGFNPPYEGPWISPDGRWAVVAAGGNSKLLDSAGRAAASVSQDARPMYWMLDLLEGKARVLLSAPIGFLTSADRESPLKVLWSPDSRRCVLVNTTLPNDWASHLVEYDTTSGAWFDIGRLFSTETSDGLSAEVRWTKPGRELLVTYSSSLGEKQGHVYARDGAKWTGRPARSAELHTNRGNSVRLTDTKPEIAIRLEQSSNTAPNVVASRNGKQLALLPPDPALQGLHYTPMREVQWKEPTGRIIKGGLILPRSSPHEAVPLVVQAYYYNPAVFYPDGSSATAYAAQALAAAGMAVLFLDIPHVDGGKEVTETPLEGKRFVERIDAAVRELAGQGLIDSARVGVVGFSRAGFMTYYAVTHPGEVKLSAAVNADGWTGSYAAYLSGVAMDFANSDVNTIYERQYGGQSFWNSRQAWLENDLTFNVDKVKTPVLFAYNGKSASVLMLDTIGAFRVNRKPFEYMNFPMGDHQLARPRERLESMTATVDWMAFWLLGREDMTGEKADKYRRWREMRSAAASQP